MPQMVPDGGGGDVPSSPLMAHAEGALGFGRKAGDKGLESVGPEMPGGHRVHSEGLLRGSVLLHFPWEPTVMKQ